MKVFEPTGEGAAVKGRKKFLLIKNGTHYYTVKTDDVVMIYTQSDITYVLNREGKKFSYVQNLNKLEAELDRRFFRANRQQIINIQYIKSFRTFERCKLLVELSLGNAVGPVHISQITAPKFKEWISGF